MAADPTLADRLDGRATFCEGYLREFNADPGYYPKDADLDRAAAVRLRKLDAIEEAVGDLDELRRWVDDHNGIMLRKVAVRIADALGGTE